MAICRPGMPSKANRAATSLIRVAPLVITTNWIRTMIEKMISPTTILSPATNSPNASNHPPGREHPVGLGPGEDQSRRGHVQHEPGQRGGQQQRRKDAELQRRAHEDGRQQDDDGHRDVADSSRFINGAGSGTMITNTLATIPIGRIRSRIRSSGLSRVMRGVVAVAIRRSGCVGRLECCLTVEEKRAEGTQNAAQCPGRFDLTENHALPCPCRTW